MTATRNATQKSSKPASTGWIHRLFCGTNQPASTTALATIVPLVTETPADEKETKEYQVDGFRLTRLPSLAAEILWGDEIGAGGFATVYKASWFGATIAVKVLNKFDLDSVRQFRDEAGKLQAVNQLKLTCAPEFIGYQENIGNDDFYILMEYITGQTVMDLIEPYYDEQSTTRAPLALATQVMTEITLACMELAEHRLVHADLKLMNMLWTPNHKIKLIDFAFSVQLGEHSTFTGKSASGTCRFIAPEVINFQEFSLATDIFALGTVAAILAHEGLPYANVQSIQTNHIAREMGFEKVKLSAACDPTFAKLIKQCWAKAPFKRPDIKTLHTEYKALHESLTAEAQSPRPTH